MADIDVQRRGHSIWPWVIGLVILALLIWLVAEIFVGERSRITEGPEGPTAVEEPAKVAPPPAKTAPGAVTDYANTCIAPARALQHELTAECLQHLVTALDAIIQRDDVDGADISQRLGDLRRQARTLEEGDAQATTHAGTTREAFASAADLMESVYRSGYGSVTQLDDAITEVHRAARAVRGDVPLLEQTDAVQAFFREAGDVLQILAQAPAGGLPTV